MHDGTQKFGKELNGVILTEMSNIVNVPWELKEGWGGSLNAEKLVDHIITTIIFIHPLPLPGNAFYEFCHWLPHELKVSLLRNPLNILKLPNFFLMMKKTKLLR